MVTQEERQRWQRDARKSWRRAHQPQPRITLMSHVNAIAARIMQHFPIHRIVILFFAAIFIGSILHAENAEAKASYIAGSTFQTDNYVRVDMAQNLAGVNVSAQVDGYGGCPTWTDSDRISEVIPPCTTGSLRQDVARRLFAYQGITSGYPSGGANPTQRWIQVNDGQNTSANGNFTEAFFVNFSRAYPATNFHASLTSYGTLGGAGSITIWFEARASNNTVLRAWTSSTACDVPPDSSGAAALTIDQSFAEISLRKINVAVNSSQCTFSSNSFAMSWWQFGVWNLGNKTASLEFSTPGLDYGDYLVTSGNLRAATGNGNAGTNDYANCGNCTFSVQGAGYFYGARGCSQTQCASVGDGGCAYPALYETTGGGGVTFAGMATSATNKGVCIFRLTGAHTDSVVGIFATNGQVTFWFEQDAKFWFVRGNAGCGGTLAPVPVSRLNLTPGCLETPLVRGFNTFGNIKSIAGLPGNTFDGFGLVVPDNADVLGTVSQEAALSRNTLQSNNPDERLVDTVTASKFAKGRQSFTVTLNPNAYFGNAIYFTLAATNATATPEICTSTQNVTVNTAPLRLAWTRSGRDPTLAGIPFARVCAWLIDDYVRTSGIRDTDANGNWLFLDNGRAAALRTYSVEVLDWPDENANAGNGHPLRFVQGFWALHTERIACNKDQNVCFGNLDTSGVPLVGAISFTQWNWTTRDNTNRSNNVGLFGVRVFDAVGGASGITSITLTPPLQLTTAFETVRWIVTKEGYLTAYLNMTNVTSLVAVNVTVHMTRNVSTPYQTTNCSFDGTRYQCVIAFFDVPTNDSCDLLDAGKGFKCESGQLLHVKRFIFFCPVDLALSTRDFLLNASYAETGGSGFAVTLTACGGAANYGDATTLAVQTSTATFELTRIGYRSLKFTQTNFTPDLIFIVPWMQKGNGDATEIVKIFYFGNVADPYSNNALRSFMYLYVIDNGAAGLTQEELRGLNFNIATGLPNLCDAMGLRGEAGHAICGIGALVTIIFAVGGMYYVAFQNTPPGNVMGLVGMLSFLGLSWVGLFPFWLVLIMVLFIIALVLLPFIRGGD